MDWNAAFKTIAALIVSVGGAGAIIACVTKFAADHIADRMMHKYEAKLNKELEQYKHELELETEKYRRMSERLTYVTKKQFETEFAAYQALFDNLFDFATRTDELFPIFDQIPKDKEEEKQLYIERYKEYCASFNKFSEVLEKNAPFIPEENYEMFVSLRTRARELGCMYPEIRIIDDPIFREDHSKIAHENYTKTREFNEEIKAAKKKIREYLSTLKVEE